MTIETEIQFALQSKKIFPLYVHLYDNGYALGITLIDQDVHQITKLLPYSAADLLEDLWQARIPWYIAPLLELCAVPLFYKNHIALKVIDDRHSRNAAQSQSHNQPSTSNSITISASQISSTNTTTFRDVIILRPTSVQLQMDLDNLLLTINDDCVENGEKYRRRREAIERKFHMLVGRNIIRDDAITTVPTMGGAIKMERSRKRKGTTADEWLRQHCSLGCVLDVVQQRRAIKIKRTHQLAKQFANMPADSTKPMNVPANMNVLSSPIELANRRSHRESSTVSSLNATTNMGGEEMCETETLTIIMPYAGVQPVNGGQGVGGGANSNQHVTMISIFKRLNDQSYFGRLTLESVASKVFNGPFLLGTETDARSYLTQYLEMITEGGRKQPIHVKVKRPPPSVLQN